ncbi:hypothetical protein [Aliarcobacter butzleri]|uniref:hypothetical protein n=1 Tax=Aliarcobacter butzleri TaxID=28197 RepID=UPI00344EAC04
MDLYLQMGHGMMGIAKDLITSWGSGTVILSPRDLTEQQTIKFAEEIIKKSGNTLFDPQYYNPHADHKKLTEWRHWFNQYDTSLLSENEYISNLFAEIKDINDCVKTSAYIIPGILCNVIDKHWLTPQQIFLDQANIYFTDKEKYATLALEESLITDEEDIEKLIEVVSSWNVDGFYIVPQGEYLTDEENWLSNLTLLVAGLKLQNKKVIVGYANHQMLLLSCANIDAIASGTFLNIRHFSKNKFDENEEDSQSRRTTWYYCPQAMSEYRKRTLDTAFNRRDGSIDLLKPYGKITDYTNILFQGITPSSTEFKDTLSFKHYLDTLKKQCIISKKDTFDNTINFQEELADNAYKFIRQLKDLGIRENGRSFLKIYDSYKEALLIIKKQRGPLLKRNW